MELKPSRQIKLEGEFQPPRRFEVERSCGCSPENVQPVGVTADRYSRGGSPMKGWLEASVWEGAFGDESENKADGAEAM